MKIKNIIKFMIKKYYKSYMVFISAICIVCYCCIYFLFNIWSPLKHPVTIIINRGMSVVAVSNYLSANHIIHSQTIFKLCIQLNGGIIQAGEYDLKEHSGMCDIAKKISKGDVTTTTVTIPEGYTIKQIQQLLSNTSSLSGMVTCNTNEPICHVQDGDVFPDTYIVAKGTNRLAVLELARQKMLSVQKKYSNWNFPKPLNSWKEVVTLASIIQKETPLFREMPIVASVYLNRLNKNMRLQADPTVVYVLTNKLGDMNGAPLLLENLKINSPYNTYINKGLPPLPIANVGMEAIRAVLNPDKTNYLYFVADGTGGHVFSTNYEQHQFNRDKWRIIKKLNNK